MDMLAKFNLPTGGAGTDYVTTIAQREFDRRGETVGGFREAAAGGTNRAGRVIRRDYLLDIVLRIYESEITAIETMIAWMQDNFATPFTHWPDYVTTPALSFSALLVSPAPGDPLEFPKSEFPGMRDVRLTLRRADGLSWDLEYYGDT